MPSTIDNNELLLRIKAFKAGKAGTPTMPVNVLVQEADDLYLWCQDDQEQLILAGLDWQQVSLIPACAAMCRAFQSQWLKDSNSGDKIRPEWEAKLKEALALCSEMKHNFLYAFRKDGQLCASVEEAAPGKSPASLVQGLNDLAVLGRGHEQLLDAVGFDMSRLETAAQLAPELAGLIARMKRSKKRNSESKTMRDQAYAYLKSLVDEVRSCGKFKFRDNAERRIGYSSNYWNAKNAAREKKPPKDGGE